MHQRHRVDVVVVGGSTHAVEAALSARALYRCGDQDGLGERILRSYLRDLRGLLSGHARHVLGAGGRSAFPC